MTTSIPMSPSLAADVCDLLHEAIDRATAWLHRPGWLSWLRGAVLRLLAWTGDLLRQHEALVALVTMAAIAL